MKPKTLDSSQIIGLNTLISCRGHDFAEAAYRDNCVRVELKPEPWAIRYLRLYAKYRRPSRDTYIDVKAAKRALDEA